ncbi:hypothetical protein [Achromobacter xylosoxidans]|uniref:hypothetical protein n=1 Tax=Alcaligenes xylosoxydans xylosoxydans TaxID=85698 RepID=UPI0003D592DF|nr:hypothetical protein [Achromobacter xylosoxidans]AHC47977.1 hypothetical protein AX27061_3517 [Achromobacter xylosoxidans NBRC 15126 = ATCC 27061]QKQ52351.1 hypothetical protein FOC83_04940 [Achromobacter xylosoxidans]QPR92767.1 hypothetical protein I6G72_19080 [Achromobacter xylosoxidans]UON42446.1 hypothetical protein IUJ48_10200 [Achromobacter xylosoxidans]CKH66655.1 Uncharacterised protein [Achromobacter xylosoxidans]
MLSTHAAPAAISQAANADSYSLVHLAPPTLSDADVLSVLCDLFAGRAATAFGESLEWWAETFQCDLAAKAAGGVVLAAISKWPFDQRAGAEGVEQLQAELVKRARQILARGVQP